MQNTQLQLNLNLMIEDIQKKFPEFLRATDLIKSGLYKSRSDLCWSIKRNQAPPSIKLSTRKVVFPRTSLCEWLQEKAENNPVEVEGVCNRR